MTRMVRRQWAEPQTQRLMAARDQVVIDQVRRLPDSRMMRVVHVERFDGRWTQVTMYPVGAPNEYSYSDVVVRPLWAVLNYELVTP